MNLDTTAQTKNKLMENLMNINEALKLSLEIAQKNFYKADEMAKDSMNKQLVLKQEIVKKDKALQKYKAALYNHTSSKKPTTQEHHDMHSEAQVKELRAQLQNQDQIMNILKSELGEKSRFFSAANEWNFKCSREKGALIEQHLKLKETVGLGQMEKFQSMQKYIAELELELAKAKNTNETLAVHIFGLEAKNAEIPKLQG